MAKEEEPEKLDAAAITIRPMERGDLETVIEIDEAILGRNRADYLDRLLKKSITAADTQISLVALVEGEIAGFIGASLFYGDFGLAGSEATVDIIAVKKQFRKRNVGSVLLSHLKTRLAEYGISSLRLEIAIHQYELLSFFRSEGFRMSSRICLETDIEAKK